MITISRLHLARFQRISVRLWLACLLCTLPIIASAGPLVEGLAGNHDALLIGVVGVLGGIVSLLVAIVALVRSWVARMEPRIPRAGQAAPAPAALTIANAEAISDLANDVLELASTVRVQGQQIAQARKTSEENLKSILVAMSTHTDALHTAISAIARKHEVTDVRIRIIEDRLVGEA